MVAARSFRRQQQEDQIDRAVVHRLEVDGFFQPREEALGRGQARQPPMRHGDAVADAGRTQPLAFHQDVEQRPLLAAEQGCGALGQILDRLFLVGGFEVGGDRFGRQQVGDFHGAVLWLDGAHNSIAFSRRRCTEEGMRIASRYLATVRRAMSTPSLSRISTIRSSDSTSAASESMSERMRKRTASAECASPEEADMDEVKKYFNS